MIAIVMSEAFSRTELLVGPEGMAALAAASVAVVGLGGVGSFAAEALARSGVGRLVLVDEDIVGPSNLNRQIIALRSSLGKPKAEVMRDRVLDINPECRVEAHAERFGPASAERLLEPGLAYVVDAIDAVSAKVELVLRARAIGARIVSAMGTGGKLDPARLEVVDLYDTELCPLARVMRRELKRRGVESLTVVYSRESSPHGAAALEAQGPYGGGRRSVPGSAAFVPASAGLLIASLVVRGILSAYSQTGQRFSTSNPTAR
jgi:tRNA threonylcarbamoyladenosine dehydratase